jgi:hypothetical protein
MPGGDRTGPMGFGPMTGRAAGLCAGYPTPGYMNPGPGRGMAWGRGGGWGYGRGYGRGFGRGWGRGYYPFAPAPAYPLAAPYPAPEPVSATDELKHLKAQADYYAEILEDLKKRMSELEKEKSK